MANRRIPHIFKYLGPGILVTVGFIDPGNWAANLSAGANFNYNLLWMVSLSTIMLIVLQHNVAHLGISTGYCLAENIERHFSLNNSRFILSTAFLASIATALAEILGAAIAINILTHLPLEYSAILVLGVVIVLHIFNSYKKIENIIIGFVSIISFCFIYELFLVDINWGKAVYHATVPTFPTNSLLIIVSVLGAVVMPHNLFLHSEIIQSRKWYNNIERIKKKLLKYEFLDTLMSMIIGWAINCSIILLSAEVFFVNNIEVDELSQAASLLEPILGNKATILFAIALLFAGISSSLTAGLSGGIIFSSLFNKEYEQYSNHARSGAILTLIIATIIILFISNPLKSLIYSQIILSMQLPITIFVQLYLTSSEKVMGRHKNSTLNNIVIALFATFISILNIILLISFVA